MSNWVVLFDDEGLQSLVPVDHIEKEVFLMDSCATLTGLVMRACLVENSELWFYAAELADDEMRNFWEEFPEEMKKTVREKGLDLKSRSIGKVKEEIELALERHDDDYWGFTPRNVRSGEWLRKTLKRLNRELPETP